MVFILLFYFYFYTSSTFEPKENLKFKQQNTNENKYLNDYQLRRTDQDIVVYEQFLTTQEYFGEVITLH
jgi:hypothetical protein